MAEGSTGPVASHCLDVRGFRCPVPVGEARKALGALARGACLEVRFDDPEALEDLPPMVARLGQRVVGLEEGAGDWRLFIEVVA